jgi:hypothetical protein
LHKSIPKEERKKCSVWKELRLLLAVGALASSPAWADVERIGIHLGTKHAQGTKYENLNPGAYIVWQSGATVGAYRNSEGAGSAYAGWTWGKGPLSVTAMAVTGYKRAPIVPGLVPSVRIPITDKSAARVSFILAPEKKERAVHFSMEFKL